MAASHSRPETTSVRDARFFRAATPTAVFAGLMLAAVLEASAPALAADPPAFVDVSTEAGLVPDRLRSWGSPLWTDLDLDGDLDLIVPVHGPLPWVYRNDGNGRFTLMSPGLPHLNQYAKDWHGFSLGDYDGDGFPDLSVTLGNPNGSSDKEDALWRNLGNAAFSYATPATGVRNNPGRGRVTYWFDYDGDGDLDLFVYNFDTASRLYRNDGAAGFTDIAAAAKLDEVGQGGGMSMVDYDNDGRLDFFASNIVLRNRGDGSFDRLSLPSGLGQLRARNLAWADFNRDGFPDLYAMRSDPLLITAPATDKLFTSVGGSSFVDVTTTAGVNLPILAASASWVDFDNDGWMDLFVLGIGVGTLDVERRNRLYRNNRDGTFTDVAESAGLAAPLPGERPSVASWGDYDGDGFMDLVIKYGHGDDVKNDALSQGPARLYRNLGNGNHYLRVALAGSPSNAAGIGARVELTTTSGSASGTQYQQMTGGSHQFGQDAAPLHFGLGEAASAKLVVRWPSGAVQTFPEILGDRRFVAKENVAPLGFLRVEPPRQVSRDTAVALKVTGTSFYDTTAVAFSPDTGITVAAQRLRSSTQIQVNIRVDASAPLGLRDLILTNADGQRVVGVGAIEIK